MIAIVKRAENKKASKRGKPPHLSVEDRLLMSLEYLREYRTYFHLGQSYGLSESACYRNCRWVENTLIKSKAFCLPGKKALLKSNTGIEVILMDATETPIERPKKKNTIQKTNKKQEQQSKEILFWEKEKTYSKESSNCR
jgi:hypothetical protein